MTRKEALTALLEKVEAGTAHDWRPFRKAHVFETERVEMYARYAYEGSLDAALALHNAVLPEWTRSVDATAPECGIDVWLHPPIGSTFEVAKATSEKECRAYAIAILKALLSQGEGTR